MTDLIVGVDEVGRGAWFGPVVAAAVMISEAEIGQLESLGVKDSKALSAPKRRKLAAQIQKLTKNWQIGYGTVKEIDQVNILQASLLAMSRAIVKLKQPPDLCLIDGPYLLPNFPYPQQCLVRGDQNSPVIAAASIIAKVWRDELITRWHHNYPQYDLAQNKGYGTAKHRAALLTYGPSPQHRLSFRPCQLALGGGIFDNR